MRLSHTIIYIYLQKFYKHLEIFFRDANVRHRELKLSSCIKQINYYYHFEYKTPRKIIIAKYICELRW